MNLIHESLSRAKEQGIAIEDIFNDIEFDWFPYEKYGQTVMVFHTGDSPMNISIINDLGKDIHEGTRKGYDDTREFVEYFAERITLCLNAMKGKTNEEIERTFVYHSPLTAEIYVKIDEAPKSKREQNE